jgi:hypothetical protein
MVKKTKKPAKRKAKPDFSQTALSVVQKAVGEKLVKHSPKRR